MLVRVVMLLWYLIVASTLRVAMSWCFSRVASVIIRVCRSVGFRSLSFDVALRWMLVCLCVRRPLVPVVRMHLRGVAFCSWDRVCSGVGVRFRVFR